MKRSVERDWGLYQLKPAQTSLEDVFVLAGEGEAA